MPLQLRNDEMTSLLEADFVQHGEVMKVINVRGYHIGAKGDGVTDDTTAIQKALTAASVAGGIVYFPAGTYIVEGAGGGAGILTIGGQNVRVIGAGSSLTTIKVADGAALAYRAILMGTITTTNLSGLEVAGICFDHNISNNPLTNTAQIAADLQYSINANVGTNIRIHDCHFKNASSINQIAMQGSATQLTQIWVENNLFTNLGDDPNHVAHDASAIYVHADEVVISGNIIVSAGVNKAGAIAAIETHASSMTVTDNIIMNWRYGMNITGVDNVGDNQRQIVANNTIESALIGILLWSWVYPAQHTSGYGIDGFIVSNNSITLAQTGTYSLSSDPVSGIVIQFDSDLDIRNLIIENNQITSPLEGSDITSTTTSIGIGFFSNDAITLEDCVIRGNTVINFPMAAIRFSGCDLTNMIIDDNLFVNCGSTLDADQVVAYRTPLFIAANNINGLAIDNNRFIDDIATTRISYFIYLLTQTSAENVRIVDNFFKKDGTGGNWIKEILVGENLSQPLIIGDTQAFVTPTGQVNTASRLTDRSTSFVYVTKSDGVTWYVVDWAVTWLETGDFTIGAGWGNTATISTLAQNSTDKGFIAEVTANGTGIAANPTLRLTFKDSAYTYPPFASVTMSGGTGARAFTNMGRTADYVELTYLGTPVAGSTYQFTVVIVP